MVKCLVYAETPCIETGGGRVSQKILSVMRDLQWDVSVVGINHYRDIVVDAERWPFTFYGTDTSDFYNLDNARQQILEGDYDVLFLTGDINHLADVMPWALEAREKRDFKIFSHVALDVAFDMAYVKDFAQVDYPSCFSEYAKQVISAQCPDVAHKLMVIPHWFEPSEMYPLSRDKRQEIRKNLFPTVGDKFFVLSINRNQRRKDLARVMLAFHLFHEKYTDSVLYMHAAHTDIGGHLPSQAKLLGLTISGPETEVIFAPPDYAATSGVSREMMNFIYNSGDVCVSCAQGEGWGLSTSEAMAAGTPFIGPHNTVFPEILGNGERGYLVASGGDDLWVIHYGFSEEPRPITSVSGMAKALEHVYLNRGEAMQKAAKARAYAEEHGEDEYKKTWQHLLTSVTAARP